MARRNRKKVYKVKYPIDLAIDAGNGTTCVVTERTNPIVFPSVIQHVEDIRLGGIGTQRFTIHVEQKNTQTGEWKERKSFAVGETAQTMPGIKTRITSKERIGSEYQVILILAGTVRALDEMIESQAEEFKVSVNWRLNIPPVYYRLVSKMFDLSGEYRVEYNKRSYIIDADVAYVYPEGAGAGATYMLGQTGQFVNMEFANARIGVIDAGYRTIDLAIFEKGALIEDSGRSLTNSISGVYQLMQTWAAEEFDEDWTEEECETNLRNGHAILKTSKEKVDLTEWIEDLGERLAELIDRDIFQKQWNDLGDVDRVILAGGGAYMVAPHLKDMYPNVIALREEYANTANVPYELMNAIGHMRLLIAERAQQAKEE